MNVSKSGMAVMTPMKLQVASQVELRFSLNADYTSIDAHGTVVWDDKHGKSGISFRCATPKMEADLNSWLDAQFLKLPESDEQ